jgi:hypothetical protein
MATGTCNSETPRASCLKTSCFKTSGMKTSGEEHHLNTVLSPKAAATKNMANHKKAPLDREAKLQNKSRDLSDQEPDA